MPDNKNIQIEVLYPETDRKINNQELDNLEGSVEECSVYLLCGILVQNKNQLIEMKNILNDQETKNKSEIKQIIINDPGEYFFQVNEDDYDNIKEVLMFPKEYVLEFINDKSANDINY